MIKLKIKPLSVNVCWKGRRFKTDRYKGYERALLYMLPKGLGAVAPFRIKIEFGFESSLADLDNPLKPFLDILQKKYGINDRDIYRLEVVKRVVKKGCGYVGFEIESELYSN